MATLDRFRGFDCWRTWFFDECEQAGLFGINEKHLGIISLAGEDIVPYHVGTLVYLEDAPFFKASDSEIHRVCGPYKVQAAVELPEGATVVHSFDGRPIVYLDPYPERGPWGNGKCVRKDVSGFDLSYRQLAKQFNYYPYRFRIIRSNDWGELLIPHKPICELCDESDW